MVDAEPGRDPLAFHELLELARVAAGVIHGAQPIDHKLAWICEAARAGTNGSWAAFLQAKDGSARVRMTAGVDPAEIAPMADVVLSRVLRVNLAGTDALHVADARVLGFRGRDGSGELVAVPVAAPSDVLHGALLVGTADTAALHPEAEGIVRVLAAHLAVALDNLATITRLAELEATQREVVHQLQDAVQPPAPNVPGVELGVHYLAADPQAPTGGDLYDWQVLPDGDLHIAVVDVLGKGVGATKDALAVTYTLRLLVLGGCSMADLVARADELLQGQTPDLVATLMVARYRPSTGEVWLAGGGHPPALLVRQRGTVTEVTAPGIPIGWPGAGSTEVAHFVLDRSDTLLLYTDGLIESTKNVVDGLRHLVEAARETATYPADQLTRALVERTLAGAERRDDTLALALRRRTAPVAERPHFLGPFQYRFTANVAAVPLARHLLAEWLARQPIDAGAIDDLLLVASELCANAVRAARSYDGGVVLRAAIDDDAVVIEVENDGGGTGLAVDEWLGADPDPDAEQGRGLFLVSTLSDDLEVRGDGARTVVRSVKRAVVAVRQT